MAEGVSWPHLYIRDDRFKLYLLREPVSYFSFSILDFIFCTGRYEKERIRENHKHNSWCFWWRRFSRTNLRDISTFQF